MKQILLLSAALFSTSVLANPITEAVKDQAWPLYTCTMDVNGQEVKTLTNDTQYSKYSIAYHAEMFTYPINADSELVLVIDTSQLGMEGNNYYAQALLYKGKEVVGQYKGYCKK